MEPKVLKATKLGWMLGLRLIKQRCEEEIRGDKKRYGFSQLLGIQLIFQVSGEVVSFLFWCQVLHVEFRSSRWLSYFHMRFLLDANNAAPTCYYEAASQNLGGHQCFDWNLEPFGKSERQLLNAPASEKESNLIWAALSKAYWKPQVHAQSWCFLDTCNLQQRPALQPQAAAEMSSGFHALFWRSFIKQRLANCSSRLESFPAVHPFCYPLCNAFCLTVKGWDPFLEVHSVSFSDLLKQISFCMSASFADTPCLYPFFNKPPD